MALFTPSQPGLVWNSGAGRYRGANGRFLSALQIRSILDADLENTERLLRENYARLRTGEQSLEAWRDAHARLIKHAHIAGYASARGGYHKLTPSDLGRIGARVKEQYRYLNRFTALLSSNPDAIGNMGMEYRAGLYARAARVTFEQQRQRFFTERGAQWARRILHSRESCPGCEEWASKGWVSLDEMPAIGDLECNIFCACTILVSYAEQEPDEDNEGDDEFG